MSFNKFTTSDKKRITNDWHQLFPSLGIYKTMHLMNRVGPLIVGLLLETKSGGNDYIPTFHVHNLTRPFPVISLSLATTLNNEYVHLEWHESRYRELAERMRNTALIPFDGNLELNEVLSGYMQYLEKPTIPYQPQFYEDMALISGWCGNYKEIKRILDSALKDISGWPKQVLTRIGNIDEWLKKVEEKSSNKVTLKSICEKQIDELRVNKIPSRLLK